MAQTLEHNKAVTEVIPVTLPEFEADMAVIQKLGDEPNDVDGLTAAELKAKFDEGGMSAKDYINGTLLPAIIADELTETTRRNAEAERVNNEAERVDNENARIAREGRIVAEAESLVHGGTGTREGEDEDNAAYYAQKTEEAAEKTEKNVKEAKAYMEEAAAQTAANAAEAKTYMDAAIAATNNCFSFGTDDLVAGVSPLAKGIGYFTIYKA